MTAPHRRAWVPHVLLINSVDLGDQTYARRMRNLRLPGVLIALGYGGIAAGTVAWLVALISRNPWEIYVGQATPMIGFGLAGFACWRWIVRCRDTHAGPLGSAPSRWMAAASAVTAAGWAAVTYAYYLNHQSLLRIDIHGPSMAILDPHYRLRMAGGFSIIVGLLLAGAGFWIVASGASSSIERLDDAVASS